MNGLDKHRLKILLPPRGHGIVQLTCHESYRFQPGLPGNSHSFCSTPTSNGTKEFTDLLFLPWGLMELRPHFAKMASVEISFSFSFHPGTSAEGEEEKEPTGK